MKINSLILLVISLFILFSCDDGIKFDNPNDENTDSSEIQRICERENAECGSIEIEYNGKKTSVFCGKCGDGYECGTDYKCADIDECTDSKLNNCPENADCNNLDTKSDGKPYECICKENYSGDNCVPDSRTKECVDLPENAEWNSVSEITQTWNGFEWSPSNEGTFDEKASENECRFKCNEHYSWKESKCVADTRTAQCEGLPENALWNNASEIKQTWNGSEWIPSEKSSYNEEGSESECKFKCNTNYNWNGSVCEAGTQIADCGEKPENSIWNDNGANGKFTQTWSGEEWLPASYDATFSKTAESCTFICDSGYVWFNNSCVTPPTQTAQCTGLPANAVWNSTATITQTYNGESWNPSSVGIFDQNPSSNECRFKCDEHYNWNSSSFTCDPETQTYTCSGKPANSSWNSVSSYTQTWNGNGWSPAASSATYNTTASTTECRFKCNEHYNWNSTDKKCDAAIQQGDCSPKPVNSVWNDNGKNGKFDQIWGGSAWNPATYASEYNETAGTCRYICDSDSHRESSECVSNTRTTDCPAKPANSVWNDNGANGSFSQNWTGSSWNPLNYTTEYSENAGTCKYKCDSSHTWENSSCINQKTANCPSKPANTVWNDNGANGTFTQNWANSSWNPASYASEYSESSGICKYKCAEHYNWNSSTSKCNPATQPAECSEKPENSIWNDGGKNGKFTQTWSDSGWNPPSYESEYSESAGVCKYKCNTGFYLKNSLCVKPCDPNPCTNDTHSNGICTAIGSEAYSCGCLDGFSWNGGSCQEFATGTQLGNICTGQEACWNDIRESNEIPCPAPGQDFFGQDGNYIHLCTPQKLQLRTLANQDVIYDRNTGLQWQRSMKYQGITWNEAYTYCDKLEYAGFSDWRLPTPQEFLTTIDRRRLFAQAEYFPCGATYWTSKNTYVFESNMGGIRNPDLAHYKICVRGKELPVASFESSTAGNSDIVVTDSKTGLMWQKTTEVTDTWKEALEYCENLNYAGFSDWRLPNINELASLLNYDKTSAPYSDFPEMPGSAFWSSTDSANDNYNYSEILSVDFYSGTIDRKSKNSEYGSYNYSALDVRCVRYSENNDPCENHICGSVENSTHRCIPESRTSYSCECSEGYAWNGSQCAALNLPECSSTSGTPCKDSTTGLIWSAKSSKITYDYAIAHCRKYSEGGLRGWRLPTISELRTLIQNCDDTVTGGICGITDNCLEESCAYSDGSNSYCIGCNQNSNETFSKLGDGNEISLWSSSARYSNGYSSGSNWAVDFRGTVIWSYDRHYCNSYDYDGDGYYDHYDYGSTHNVRCVKNAE